MPYVWMDEVTRVQTVGSGGIGVSPAVPVEAYQRANQKGRTMVKSGNTDYNVLPNPYSASDGNVLKASSGKWAAGTDKDSLPSATGKADGSTLAVASGAWTVVAPE